LTVRDLLPLYAEGEIDPIRARLVQAHLESCGACRAERGALAAERLWLLEQMVESPPLSTRLRKKVIDRIRQRERAARARRRWTFLVRASGLASAAALAIGACIVILRGPWGAGGAGPEAPDVALEAPAAPLRVIAAPIRLAAHRTQIDPAAAPPAEEPEARPFRHSPSFGDVLGIARRIVPAESAAHPGEPCPPDSNKDGRLDIIDIAYSCQIIMGAPPPGGLGEAETAPLDPECDEHCLRV
jgi:hypothetical protein